MGDSVDVVAGDRVYDTEREVELTILRRGDGQVMFDLAEHGEGGGWDTIDEIGEGKRYEPIDTHSSDELAERLVEHGVPEKRARVVALVAAGHSYREIADRDDVGVSVPGGVANYVADYRQQLEEAVWLAEHGPEL